MGVPVAVVPHQRRSGGDRGSRPSDPRRARRADLRADALHPGAPAEPASRRGSTARSITSWSRWPCPNGWVAAACWASGAAAGSSRWANCPRRGVIATAMTAAELRARLTAIAAEPPSQAMWCTATTCWRRSTAPPVPAAVLVPIILGPDARHPADQAQRASEQARRAGEFPRRTDRRRRCRCRGGGAARGGGGDRARSARMWRCSAGWPTT